MNRYYLRIFCWALNRVIHAAYVVVCFHIKSDIRQKQWKQYLDHHSGHHDFQIDLALSVMNYGIGLQWDGESDKRPNFFSDKTLSSHAIATNVFLFEGNHHRYCASTDEETKSNCGVQMRNMCDDK